MHRMLKLFFYDCQIYLEIRFQVRQNMIELLENPLKGCCGKEANRPRPKTWDQIYLKIIYHLFINYLSYMYPNDQV